MATDTKPRTGFPTTSIDITSVPLAAEAKTVKRAYEEIFGEKPENRGGWFHPADWSRTSYVLSRLDSGERVLDVGLGAGQFINMIDASGKFTDLHGLDRARFNKYTELSDRISRVDGSIADMDYPDDSFDVVTCMEVLEHIPTEIFDAGVRELRRVCRGQLIMTVPFKETEPLSKGHVRRFVEDDILEIFPDGRYTVLDRPKKPWILIEERLGDQPVDGTLAELADARLRIEALENQVMTLKARKALRSADWVGRSARSALRAARSVLQRD